jgi:hypothetical protein
MLAKNHVVVRRWKALPAQDCKELEGQTESKLKEKLDLWKLR